jgi:hypothetical protein
MKTLTKNLTVLLLAAVMLTSCKKNDDNSNPSSSGISSTVQQGSWRVSLFQEDSVVETSLFNAYAFTFQSNGNITANKGSNTVTGTWSAENDDNTSKITIDFGTISPFEELNEDWDILEQNASIIRLKHTSGGNGGVDYLNFEKI